MTRELVLIDTSIWVDYINNGDFGLSALLDENRVLVHAYVIGEVALGSIRDRSSRLRGLCEMPSVDIVAQDAVLALIDSGHLWGTGIGYVDAHLLAAALAADVGLWTRDKRLRAAAERLGIAAEFA